MVKHADAMIAGPLAGAAVVVLFYPLDTIKTRLQSPGFRHLLAAAGRGSARRKLMFKGLYQGVGPLFLVTLPASAVFFAAYETTKHELSYTSLPAPLSHGISSTIGEILACAVATPAEVIKQNAQVLVSASSASTTTLKSRILSNPSIAVLRSIRRPSDLWRGYTVFAARNIPFAGLQLPVYEWLKTYFRPFFFPPIPGKPTSPRDAWIKDLEIVGLAAGLSSAVAAFLTTPIDVVKTRIMLSAGKDTERPRAFWVFMNVLRREGVVEVFRGGALRSIWMAAGSAVYLGVYEGTLAWLGEKAKMEEEPEIIKMID
ncbi:hypothetical protein RUND412_000608 [Rhizina undulata]